MIDEQSKRRTSFWRELPVLLVVAVVVAVVVRAFVLQTFWIPSESMQNTLEKDDRVLVNKLVYKFRGPDRGEVIVFTAPKEWRSDPSEEDFIKRVIAKGGDNVMCCDAQQRIVVNGVALDESKYLFKDEAGRLDPASSGPFNVTIEPGRLWVMGDHRSASGDSREHFLRTQNLSLSTIPESAVVGRAFLLFWPLGRASWLSVPDAFAKVPRPPGH